MRTMSMSKIKLVLNERSYPSKFNEIKDINAPANVSKIKYIESYIIKSINEYNNKLNISEITYENLDTQFSNIHTSNSTGAIVEEIDILDSQKELYAQKDFYVYSKENKFIARRIVEYVFISLPTEASRTAFCSQVIFPTLIDYIQTYINSPSYSAANHKFMFINIVNDKITSKYILRPLAALIKIGMDYVDVFKKSILIEDIPNDLKTFMQIFENNFDSKYDSSLQLFNSKYYSIDFKNKILKIKKEYIEDNIEQKKNGFYDFKGSSEKFYWITIYPTAIFAYNSNFTVDYSEYIEFCDKYDRKFNNNSDKFSRFKFFIIYFKKYFK